ncbi:hypothetical protein QWZ02_09400 [Kinneretia asaccharophila]|uniref:Uncharacterized protein n=1 Tax=Roseateles asaccharophilus TaxID=582607 RepID=A0A4R6N7Y2_9BURK|nr:hypothetical protein [Roseateles asaccharophilus]MDN3544662.1 hypothetical protein [Roseateles asaccharophilus]TDP09571.1 hypothetical protein DFR39_104132 [Roseateles asaccharophilus]
MSKQALAIVAAVGVTLAAVHLWRRKETLDLNRNQAAGPRLPGLPSLPPLPAISGAAPNMPRMPDMPKMPSMGGAGGPLAW